MGAFPDPGLGRIRLDDPEPGATPTRATARRELYCPPQVSELIGTLRIMDAFYRSFSDHGFDPGVISDYFGARFAPQNGP
jgi:hypothetical protein